MHPLWRRRATCAAVAAGSAFSVDRLTNGGFRSLALVAGVGFAIFTNLMIQATTMCVWLRALGARAPCSAPTTDQRALPSDHV